MRLHARACPANRRPQRVVDNIWNANRQMHAGSGRQHLLEVIQTYWCVARRDLLAGNLHPGRDRTGHTGPQSSRTRSTTQSCCAQNRCYEIRWIAHRVTRRPRVDSGHVSHAGEHVSGEIIEVATGLHIERPGLVSHVSDNNALSQRRRHSQFSAIPSNHSCGDDRISRLVWTADCRPIT